MDVDKHYQRKEHALFSLLERYGITGPSKVMWAKDDEVRLLLKRFNQAARLVAQFPHGGIHDTPAFVLAWWHWLGSSSEHEVLPDIVERALVVRSPVYLWLAVTLSAVASACAPVTGAAVTGSLMEFTGMCIHAS